MYSQYLYADIHKVELLEHVWERRRHCVGEGKPSWGLYRKASPSPTQVSEINCVAVA